MRLRPYAPDDWPALARIHDAARRDELAAARLQDAFLAFEQTAAAEGLFDGSLIVAVDDADVIHGFAAWCDGELTWLYVDPASYRRGVGRRLLEGVIAAAPGRLTTEVLAGNEAALALYLACGFRIERRVDGRLTGNESFAASGFVLAREA
jgi:ribosomal protein S18 acetylase RimI-like enzyme